MSVNDRQKIQDLREELQRQSQTIFREKLQRNPATGDYELLPVFYHGRKKENETLKEADVQKHWNDTYYKRFSDESLLKIRSRNAFKYGRVTLEGELPDLASYSPPDTSFWFGFELGAGIRFGAAAFKWTEEDEMYCFFGGYGRFIGVQIDNLLPSDVKTAKYTYTVEVTNGLIEFRVDKDLVAIGVFGGIPQPLNRVKVNTEPYGILVLRDHPPMAMNTLIELFSHDNSGENLTVEFPAGDMRVSTVNPLPPKTYRLYDDSASTLLTEGTYDTGTAYKSHPFPLVGYDTKTLLFRADVDSVADGLQIEVFTTAGNWRPVKKHSYTGGNTYTYTITRRFVLGRISYEPSANDASITDAEVRLK